MIGLLITLAVICFLGSLPIGVRLSYNETGGIVWLKLGLLKFRLYPKAQKDKKTENGKNNDKKSQKRDKQSKGGSLSEFLTIARIVLDFLSDFRRRLWVQNLYLQLTLAEDDPCDLAVHYGEAWAALGNLLPLLEQYVKVKKRDLRIDCDFSAETPRISTQADILITLGRFLAIALRHGVRGFKKYQLLSKKIKAVQ